MVTLKYNQKEMSIDIYFPWDPDLVDLVKLFPDREFKHVDGRKFWRVPIQASVRLQELVDEFIGDCKNLGHDIDNAQNFALITQAIETIEHWEIDNYILSSKTDYDGSEFFNTVFKSILTGSQKAAAEYMFRNAQGVINGNSSTSRILSTLAVLEAGQMYPVLIVCAQAHKFIWGSRVKLLTGKNCLLLGEEQEVIVRVRGDMEENTEKPAQVVICNYGNLPKNDWLHTVPFNTIIIDESHHIRSGQTLQASAVSKLCLVIEHRLLLSNTDYTRSPVDLVIQLEIAHRMYQLFGGRKKYLTRYNSYKETGSGWSIGPPCFIDELDKRLRSNCYVKNEVQNEEQQQASLL